MVTVRAGRRRRGLGYVCWLGAAALLITLWPAPRPALSSGNGARAAIVPIHGMISDIMRDSVQRRIELARRDGAHILIFELKTPGGMVTSALDICSLIKGLPDEVRTVAWVNDQALSAGAMIALACDEIIMSKSSRMGDCAPIMVNPVGALEGLAGAERAKIESPILQEFRDSAARNGYDQLLVRAMVTVDTEVWWIENLENTQREFVTPAEKARRIDDVPADQRQWRLVTHLRDAGGREIPVEQPIDREDSLLTISQAEAYAFGLARGIASSTAELQQLLALPAPPAYFEISGWESFAGWLNSPLVRGILFVIFLVGGYIEFQHPGLILPGVTAAIALVIFLAAPYAAGLAGTWTMIVLALGILLVLVEVFLIPGHGISGLIGVALVLLAFLGTFVPPEPATPGWGPPWLTLQATWDALRMGIIVLASGMIVSVVGLMFLLRFLPQTRVARGLVALNPAGAAVVLADPFATCQVGDVGVVTGDLRPAGQARFGQEIVEVQSQGRYVEAGRRVQVIRREGSAVIVRPIEDQA
jgi:membrane-bound serine protease (ClpP class)